MKINYPHTIVLLRGNHECRQLAVYFNFHQEIIFKYDEEVFEALVGSFDSLPLACLLNERFLVIHAGISPHIKTVRALVSNVILQIADLQKLNRFQEPPREGPLWYREIAGSLP